VLKPEAHVVLNFKRQPFNPPWVENKFYLTFAWSIVLYFFTLMRIVPIVLDLVITGWFLFHLCMFCQRQLNKTKPDNLDNLPLFYLTVSLGGLLGGVIATWVMPLLSVWSSEYLLGLAVIAAGLSVGSKSEKLGWRGIVLIAYLCILLIAWPHFFKDYNVFGVVIILWVFKVCYSVLIKHLRAFFLSILLILVITPLICSYWTQNKYIYLHRNYYGIYQVYIEKGKLLLNHGTTIHGVQFLDKAKANQLLAYYHITTPIGELLNGRYVGENIGIIGLGSGGLAAYARAGQEIDYYEIDPDMYYIASNIFSFLGLSQGKINFIFGDARITLKDAPANRYDLLIMDAFSGDAIPVHLLTIEAIQEYRKHLKPGGILLFHISNRYLNLAPVLFSNANALNAYSCWKSNDEDIKKNIFGTSWFALTWDKPVYGRFLTELGWKQYYSGRRGLLRAWTDKYSNMLLIISLNNFLSPLKYFKPFYW
jgi:SAM-dependent methyltransferase